MSWFIARCPVGAEENCLRDLNLLIEKSGMQDIIVDFFVPPRKRGAPGSEKSVSRRVNLAGYIFIKSSSEEQVLNVVSKIERLSLMVGQNSNLVKIEDEEVASMRETIEDFKKEESAVLSAGERVKVLEAPFEGFIGTIDDVDEKKQILKVSVPILGRPVSLELAFSSVTRITD